MSKGKIYGCLLRLERTPLLAIYLVVLFFANDIAGQSAWNTMFSGERQTSDRNIAEKAFQDSGGSDSDELYSSLNVNDDSKVASNGSIPWLISAMSLPATPCDPPVYCIDCDACSEPIGENPDLQGSCEELNIVLVLDESSSIASPINYTPDVEEGVMTFINTLTCTGVGLSVIEFNNQSRFVLDTNQWYRAVDSTVAAAMQNYFDNVDDQLLLNNADYNPGAAGPPLTTNWQSAMLAVNHIPFTPNLIIFFTDGVPTKVYLQNPPPGFGSDGVPCTGNPSPAEYYNAAKVANILKCAGAHMFVAGVGDINGNEQYVEAISGTTIYESGVNDITNSDYATGDYNQLAVGLAEFVSQLCPFDSEVNSQDACPGSNVGSITISIPNELTPYDYEWFDQDGFSLGTGTGAQGDSILIIPDLGAGTYRVNVLVTVPGSGCTRLEVFNNLVITENALPVVAHVDINTQPTCEDPNAGSATLTITQGEAPYMITLRKGGVIEPGYPIMGYMASMFTAIGLDSGTYTFELKDVNTCNIDIDTFILVPPMGCCPVQCTVEGDPGEEVCPNTLAVFNVTALDCESPGFYWEIIDNTSNAFIVGQSDAQGVTVNSGTQCGSYTIQSTLSCNECDPIICYQIVAVFDETPPILICPSDITLECEESTDPAHTGLGAATDNCAGDIEISYSDVISQGPDPQEYTIARTWSATDVCGNASTCMQSISVYDFIPATITYCPADVTIACDESPDPSSTGLASATDNCDNSPIVSYSDVTMAGSCLYEYSILRTWTATDSKGNVSSCTQSISIVDTLGPTLVCPADITIECNESIDPSHTGLASATDNCDGSPGISYSDVTMAGACQSEYVMTRSWIADDECGNTSTCIQMITIVDTTPPDITCPADVTVVCASEIPEINFDLVIATEICSSQPTITLVEEVISNQTCANRFTLTRTFKATDDCGNSSACEQMISVFDNVPPMFLFFPEDITIECDESTAPSNTGLATATDNCVGATEISYNDVTISGINQYEYTIERTWKAVDVCGNERDSLQIITVYDGIPPTIVFCPADVTIQCSESTDSANTGFASATDNCDGAPIVTYSDVTISGFCDYEYTIVRTWSATDVFGNSSVCEQIIEVVDTIAPEFIVCPFDITISCEESIDPLHTGMASATDHCDGSPGISYSDVTLAGACQNEYFITRSWIVDDQCGNTSICTQVITIVDATPPDITCPADVTVVCASEIPEINFDLVIATDICSSQPTITLVEEVISNQTCPNRFTLTRTFRATDDCGNSSTCEQVISVFDTVPPMFLFFPEDITIECDESTDPSNTGLATATDNCVGATEISYNDVTISGINQYEYTIERTWKALDVCGNERDSLQIITVYDGIPPTIVFCPADVTIQCSESTDSANTGVASATDNCDGAPIITYSDVTISGICDFEYTLVRTWSATDLFGNSSICEQIIEVVDTTSPMFSFCPADMTISCEDSIDPIATGMALATDNCDSAPAISVSDITISGACFHNYLIIRTWTATDACGNSTNCVQTITIEDTTSPMFSFCPADVTISCDDSTDPSETGFAMATDNCDVSPDVSFSDVTMEGTCPEKLVITRTWEVIDQCGNTAICVQVISIFDTVPPEITLCPPDVTVECQEEVPEIDFDLVVATDNCSIQPTTTLLEEVVMNQTCANRYLLVRTYKSTDDCGNFSTCTQLITVFDETPPVLTCPTDITLECEESTDPANTGFVSAVDNCTGEPVFSYSDVTTEGPGPQAYTITRTWSAADICGNESSCIQVITVYDSTSPTFVFCPPDITIQCDVAPDPGNTGLALATDNCDVSPVVSYDDVTMSGSCLYAYSILRTWTATDSRGNTSMCTQSINLADTIEPTLICPADITIECDEIADPLHTGLASATDNCDGSPGISYSDVTVAGTCQNEYVITRTWIAEDECGNTSTCIQLITTADTTTPEITCPVDITIACLTEIPEVNYDLVFATDNCGGQSTITLVDEAISNQICPNRFTLTRTFKATDACGNSSTCEQLITVFDDFPPMFLIFPEDITIECNESTAPSNTGLATATDNCGGITEISFNDVTISGINQYEFTIERTWKAIDDCGNEIDSLQIITVRDEVAPTIVFCPDDITILCSETTDPAHTGVASATDNCDTSPLVTYDDVTISGFCLFDYAIIRTWYAVDIFGNSTTCEQVITVVDTLTPVFIFCPPDTLIGCDESTDPFNIGFAIATDQCDVSPVITYGDVITSNPEGCSQEYAITRTWTATDACGNSSTCEQVIFVVDTIAPIFVLCPADTLIGCGESTDPLNIGFAIATDQCDVSLVVTYSDVITIDPEGCSQESTLTRTWIATDECGNSSICEQMIFIIDTIAPIFVLCPGDTLIGCDESTDPLNTGFAVATDQCDVSPAVTYSDVISLDPEGCSQASTIIRTWIATDECGNSIICEQLIFVTDTVPPILIFCPADTLISCGSSLEPLSLGLASATDQCDISPVVTYSDVITSDPEGCPEQNTIARTWIATDECGNSSSCEQLIFIVDTISPVFTICPVDTIIGCDVSTEPINTGFASASDECDVSPVITYGDIITTNPEGCSQEYTIARTWIAIDECGNSSVCEQMITVIDTIAPIFTMCPADTMIVCNESVDPLNTGFASATDNCDGAPAVSFSDVTLAGSCPQEYAISRTWTATDECGNTSLCLQMIYILDTIPPIISVCVPDITIECAGDLPEIDLNLIIASDNCGGETVITFSGEMITDQLCAHQFTLTRTFVATDACGNSTTCEQTISIFDITPPMFINLPEDITIECDESTDPSTTGFASATDNCSGTTEITFNDVTISGQNSYAYTIQRTWIATDICGNETDSVQLISVYDDSAPMITYCPPDITIACDESTDPLNTGIATATDNCDLVPVVTSIDDIVLGLCPQEVVIIRTWIATDAFGNSSSCAQIITVDDQMPPILTCPGDVTLDCAEDTSASITGFASATDNCDIASVITSEDVIIPGLCPQAFIIIRTWTATDACGNSSTCEQIITVEDHLAPFLTCPLDMTLECDGDTSPSNTGFASATDNCDIASVITSEDVIIPGLCPQAFVIIRTWTATDACGNSSTCEQIIEVEDHEAPLLTCPSDVTLACGEDTSPSNTGFASATDYCDITPVISSVDVIAAGGCPQAFIITRIWTATDACGNSSSCEQIISVEDDLAPMITCPANVTLACDEDTSPSNAGLASATDSCDLATFVTSVDVIVPELCPQAFVITRIWTATDACGNSSTCEQIITVEDYLAPLITCPSDVTLACDEDTSPSNTGIASATDNCDIASVITSEDVIIPGLCPQAFVIIRTWTATDDCGNSSSCEQVIMVDDDIAPMITCPSDATLECGEDTSPSNTGIASATDNCDIATMITSEDVIVPGLCPQAFVILRTWIATDACGNSSTCEQIIAVEDHVAPLFTCPSDVTLACGEDTSPSNTGLASATDNCDLASVITSEDSMVVGLCPQTFIIIRTWTATDACGNSSSCEQIISVEDDLAPMITCPSDVTLACDEDTSPSNTGFASSTDNCDLAAFVTSVDVIVPALCPQTFVIVRTWIATDACGNSSTCEQIISVEDDLAPMITCPSDVTLACDEDTNPSNTGFASATDNCEIAPVVSSVDVISAGACPQAFVINRTWTATDACGNSSTCEQIITVEDHSAPLITCSANLILECDGDYLTEIMDWIALTTASDGCDGSVILTNDWNGTDVPSLSCDLSSGLEITFTATDDCGNTSTCTRTVYVDDSTAPTIFCAPNLTLECDGDYLTEISDWLSLTTASDVCDGTVTLTNDWNGTDVPSLSCDLSAGLEITFTATDDCGNTSTCTRTVYVEDSTAPTIFCAPNLTLECDGDYLTEISDWISLTTASDICDGTVTLTNDWNGTDVPPLSCDLSSGMEITFTATDDCGNTSTCTSTVYVDDNTAPTIFCAPNLTLECDGDYLTEISDWIALTTASDACDGTLTLTNDWNGSDVPSLSCDLSTGIEITFTATDDCGNTSSCARTVYVDGSTAPIIACAPNLTLECDGDYLTEIIDWIALTTAGDDCDGTVDLTNDWNGTDVPSLSCDLSSGLVITFTATDDCGNSSTCSRTVYVDDNTAPTISCAPNLTLECDGDYVSEISDWINLMTASDDCDGTVDLTNDWNGTDVPSLSCDLSVGLDITFTATDDCGNTSTCVRTVYVDDNIAPTITCAPGLILECDGDYLTEISDWIALTTASDICDGTVSLTNDWNGTDVPALSCDLSGGLEITFTATDDCGNFATCVQTVYIDDVTNPTISCLDDLVLECVSGADYIAQITAWISTFSANDDCDSDVSITTDWNGTDLPVLSCDLSSGLAITFTATDDCGNTASCTRVVYLEDTTAPSIDCQSDLVVECADGSDYVNAINEWISSFVGIDDCDQTITVLHDWNGTDVPTLSCDLSVGLDITFTATDDCGNSTTCLRSVYIDDTTPPVIICPDDIGVECGESLSPDSTGYAIATDNCNGNPDIGFIDVTIDDGNSEELEIERTWIAIDDCGNVSTCVQLIVVYDGTPPAITCPPDTMIGCGESTDPLFTGFAVAEDNCDNSPTITFSDESMVELCESNFVVIRTWRATDKSGNSSSCVQEIHIIDQTPPEFSFCPGDISISCEASSDPLMTGMATASDDCDASPVITYNDEELPGACVNAFVINRVWTATDKCGNSASCLQVISIEDMIPPTIISCPPAITVACTDDVPDINIELLSASDNCSEQTLITHLGDEIMSENCDDQFTVVRTYMASDLCGNTATCQQLIVVADTIVPLVICPDDTVVLCAADVPDPAPEMLEISDNCSMDNFDIQVEDMIIDSICPGQFTVLRKYLVSDACGNVGQCEQTIMVNDTLPPVVEMCAIPRTLSGCGVESVQDPPFSTESVVVDPFVFENSINQGSLAPSCEIHTVSYFDISTGTCPNTVTRTWTIKDQCGQSATCQQTITVQDTEGPAINVCAKERNIEICDVSEITDPVFSTTMKRTSLSVFESANNQGSVLENCELAGVTYVDVLNDGCPSFVIRTWTFADLCGNESSCSQKITLCSAPDQSFAGEDQALCHQTSTTLSGNIPQTGTGVWSIVEGSAIILDSLSPVTEISGLQLNESVTLIWTISNGSCPDEVDEVFITNADSTSQAFAGEDVFTCDTSLFLSADDPLVGTGMWSLLSGSATIADPFDPFAQVVGLEYGTELGLVWTVSNGGCPTKSDTIIVTTALKPDPPFAGTDQVYCNLPAVPLEASVPSPGRLSGTWSLLSGDGEIESPEDPSTFVYDLGIGSNVFVWTISNGLCQSLSDTVTVFNTGEQGVQANFLISDRGCVGDNIYIFDISENEIPPTRYLWDFGDNTTSTERDPVHQYTASGEYTVTLITWLNDCVSLPRSKKIRINECLIHESENEYQNRILYANVFPNPTIDDFKVHVRLNEKSDVEVSLFNAVGQEIEVVDFKDTKEVLQAFHVAGDGVYYFRIRVKEEVLTFKVLKVR